MQPQYVYQNNDKKDPNANIFGNWLQYGFGSGLGQGNAGAPGTFSAGTTMAVLQITPTWQQKNFFVRPTIAYTHISGFAKGTGYGFRGKAADQIVGVFEVGFLLGQY